MGGCLAGAGSDGAGSRCMAAGFFFAGPPLVAGARAGGTFGWAVVGVVAGCEGDGFSASVGAGGGTTAGATGVGAAGATAGAATWGGGGVASGESLRCATTMTATATPASTAAMPRPISDRERMVRTRSVTAAARDEGRRIAPGVAASVGIPSASDSASICSPADVNRCSGLR